MKEEPTKDKPAFPFGVRVDHHDTYGGGHRIEEANEPGMSLRDYYKGQAVIGILSDKRYAECGNESACAYEIARYAGMIADALLQEGAK